MKRFRLAVAAGSAALISAGLLTTAVSPVSAATPALAVPVVAAKAATVAAPVAAVQPVAAQIPARPSWEGGSKKVVGYFTDWGIYGPNYQVKNIETSGTASKLTDLIYAFGNTADGQCSVGDSYADYQKVFGADDSVSGMADSTDPNALHGSFNQILELKKKHPGLKVLWSFGGYSWSGGFSAAAADPAAFANSCYNLVHDPRWAGVFDGIDIDWEYPNACGLTCDTSGQEGYQNVIEALRAKFGRHALISAAVTADGTPGGKEEQADYAGAAKYLNWVDVMTYDYYGTWAATGPTAPNSPLTNFAGAPTPGFDSVTTIAKLKSLGIPSSKLLLGIGFYGHGWTGVTQSTPGGTATGPAPSAGGTPGTENYNVLKTTCPATGIVGGTAYAKCGDQWWSYDTPATIIGKMKYAKRQHLGGSFFWELTGDTSNGELVSAIHHGLR